MRSLIFSSIGLILPAALSTRLYSASNGNEYQKIFVGVKRGRRVRQLTAVCEPIVYTMRAP
jgi:hypothetical protein